MSKTWKYIIFSFLTILILLYTFFPVLHLKYIESSLGLSHDKMAEDFQLLKTHLADNYVFFGVWERKNNKNWETIVSKYQSGLKNIQSATGFYSYLKQFLNELQDYNCFILSPEQYREHQLASVKQLGYSTTKYKNAFKYRIEPLLNEGVEAKYKLWSRVLNRSLRESAFNSQNTAGFETRIIAPNKIAYVKFNDFSNLLVDKDKEKLQTFWKGIKDYQHLIIDIRNNVGGSHHYWRNNIVQPLLNYVIIDSYYLLFKDSPYNDSYFQSFGVKKHNHYHINSLPEHFNMPSEIKEEFTYCRQSNDRIVPENSVRYQGKIHLLIGSGTYSAANDFARFVKSTGWGDLTGNPTNGVGKGKSYIALPNSGLVMHLEMFMVLNEDGTINKEVGVIPDKIVAEGSDALAELINNLKSK